MADNTTFCNLTNHTGGTGTGPSGKLPSIPSLTSGDIVNIAFLCILAAMIIFSNSLMIGAFYVNTRLRTRTNFLLMSLAVADLLAGTISLPLLVYISVTFSFARPVYRFYLSFDVICGVSSILNLTTISLERCYALLKPIRHRNIRKRVFIAVILVTWILATLAGTAIELLDVKYKKFYGVIVTVVFFFVPLTIILGAYGIIFDIARSHARGRAVGSSFKKDLRIARTVAIIIGLFLICLTPFFAINLTISVCNIRHWMSAGCQGLLRLPVVIMDIIKWLQYGNSVCNPIIYGLRNEEFRRTFRVILLRLCCKKVRITECDKNLRGGVGNTCRQRQPCCENVQVRSVMITPSLQPHRGLFDSQESHREAIESRNPNKIEFLTRNSLMDSLKELYDDRAFQTFPSGLTSAVAGPSSEFCNPAFEHDQMETGNYPGDEAIPKQESLTENITRLHKRSTGITFRNNETRLHSFTDSNSLEKEGDFKTTSTSTPFDKNRSLSEIFVRPSSEIALKLRSQSFS